MLVMETPSIGYRYGNILTVNGKHLWAHVLPAPDAKKHEVVTPERFSAMLDLGQAAIAAIHTTMPEAIVLRLSADRDLEGRESRKVLTPEGWDDKNPGFLDDPEHLIEPFRMYWNMVLEGPYVPRVRLLSGKALGGAWLSVQ